MKCHGEFAKRWSRSQIFLTKNLCSTMELLLEYHEKNIKWFVKERTKFLVFFPSTQGRNVKKIGHFLDVSIHILPGHPHPKMASSYRVTGSRPFKYDIVIFQNLYVFISSTLFHLIIVEIYMHFMKNRKHFSIA